MFGASGFGMGPRAPRRAQDSVIPYDVTLEDLYNARQRISRWKRMSFARIVTEQAANQVLCRKTVLRAVARAGSFNSVMLEMALFLRQWLRVLIVTARARNTEKRINARSAEAGVSLVPKRSCASISRVVVMMSSA